MAGRGSAVRILKFLIEAYLRDITGLVLEHCNKVSHFLFTFKL